MNYHALQTYVSKRAGNLFMTASYTFSKALGDSNAEGDNPEQYLNRRFNYGPTSFDRRHVFIMTYVWSLPKLRNWNPALRGVWVLDAERNCPFADRASITPSLEAPRKARAARLSRRRALPSNEGPNNWFNAAIFAAAPVSRLGNGGTGMVEGPTLRVLNLSLAKNFRFTERINLKYQADFFNAINVANFSGLGTTVTSGGFGTLSSAYPPRGPDEPEADVLSKSGGAQVAPRQAQLAIGAGRGSSRDLAASSRQLCQRAFRQRGHSLRRGHKPATRKALTEHPQRCLDLLDARSVVHIQ